MKADSFVQKVKERRTRVGVVGLGYVGLPLAIAFSRKGFPVTGFDIDERKCAMLNRGESYISYIPGDEVASLERFEAVSDFSRVEETDAVLICVPTPLSPRQEPDMRFVLSTVRNVAPRIHEGHLVSLESTTYPGTTEELVVPELEKASFMKAGRDFFVAYSPERQDPNNKEYTTETIPKIVGGYTRECLRAASALYGAVVREVKEVSSTRVAEAAKLLENIFRSVNIALVNELKVIFDRMSIDIWEVIDAAKTKPFGYMPFYPGPGLGGHCIPIDPFYLSWKAREYGVSTRFIELAGEINRAMPFYVTGKITEALNAAGKPVKGSRILLVGMAYKPDVDDLRESPSLKLMKILEGYGGKVFYHDDYIPEIPTTREYPEFAGRKSVPLENLRSYDCVVVATAHSYIDYRRLAEESSLVVDTRRACPDGENVVRS